MELNQEKELNQQKKLNQKKKGSKLKKALLITGGTFLALAVVFFIYTCFYYKADETALAVLENTEGQIQINEEADGRIVFEPKNQEEIKAGFIFYPGGKVENKAYAPLMEKLAEQGIKCVLLRVPHNLAILDMNAAEGIAMEEPEIDWYVGGHSLGGVASASYAAGHTEEVKGVVFLASYPTKDLSESGLEVISLYGTEDGVMNAGKYQQAKEKLPKDSKEVIIDGGCHAYFGNYGVQKGDGEAAITPEQQQDETVEVICEMIAEE